MNILPNIDLKTVVIAVIAIVILFKGLNTKPGGAGGSSKSSKSNSSSNSSSSSQSNDSNSQ